MINNEDLTRSILWCIENAESAAKTILSDYEKLNQKEIEEDMGYHIRCLKKCAHGILVEVGHIFNDRIAVESALPDEDDLTQPGVRPFSGKIRDSAFNGVGEDDSQMERFGGMKYISKLAGLEKVA